MDDYYVSQFDGNDSYNGLYPTFQGGSDGPWLTWNKARGETYSAGDTINFNRDDTWIIGINERWEFTDSGTPGDYITVDAYGTGALPILDSEIEMQGATWANEGGDVWSTAWTAEIYRCRLDGQDSGQAANAAAIDGTTYLWHWNTVDDKLFVYATEDPSTLYTSIKIANANNYAFRPNGCSYVKFKNLRIIAGKYAIAFNGASTEAYLEFDSVDFWYGGYVAFLVAKTTGTANNCTVKNCDFDCKLNMLSLIIDSNETPTYNLLTFQDECDDWHIHDNTFTSGHHNQVGMNAIAAPTQGCNNNIVEYNVFDGTGSVYIRGFTFQGDEGKCTGNIFRYNIEKNTNVRSQLGGNGNEVYYNLFYEKTETSSTGHSNVSEGLSIEVVEGICHDNLVYNNVFYGIFNQGLSLGNGVASILVKNNICMDCGRGGDELNICIWIHGNIGANNVISNNCFYDADTSDVIEYKGATCTVAYADANHPEFSNNIGADPKMIDPANGNFHLKGSSPCIEAGVDVSLTEDYDGVSVPKRTNPDIGAFEFYPIFNLFEDFKERWGKGVHQFHSGGHTLKVYLTNNAPDAALDAVKADLVGITEENGYAPVDIQNDYSESGGVGTLTGVDVTFEAQGGSFGPFRYAVLYNDTPTSPADPLIGWYDFGSEITCLDTQTFKVDFGPKILDVG